MGIETEGCSQALCSPVRLPEPKTIHAMASFLVSFYSDCPSHRLWLYRGVTNGPSAAPTS